MSGARRWASFHLFFKNLPRSTASEQTSQLDQTRISILIMLTKLQVRLDKSERSLTLLAIACSHFRAIESQLQVQWSDIGANQHGRNCNQTRKFGCERWHARENTKNFVTQRTVG
jgi:hypothetical protein